MLEGIQHYSRAYINALPSREKLEVRDVAVISFVLFAYLSYANNSFQKAAAGTAAYAAAYGVQVLVTPLFKQFADHDGNLDAVDQSIKDFTYQVTILAITCGFASVNPVWFGSTVLINLIWNFVMEDDHPSEQIRTWFPLFNVWSYTL